MIDGCFPFNRGSSPITNEEVLYAYDHSLFDHIPYDKKAQDILAQLHLACKE
jgi:hypothetical protein